MKPRSLDVILTAVCVIAAAAAASIAFGAEPAIAALEAARAEVDRLILERDTLLGDVHRLSHELANCETTPPAPPPPEDPPPVDPESLAIAWPPPAMTLPEPGVWFKDPTFGTRVMRIPGGVRHVYSQLTPTNSDDSLAIMFQPSSDSYGILNLSSLSFSPRAWSSPRWADDQILDISRSAFTVGSDTFTVYGVSAISVPESYERPSEDGRSVAVLYSDAKRIGVVDLLTRSLLYSCGASLEGAKGGVNWVRVSPRAASDGFFVQYSGGGTWWYWPDCSTRAKITDHHRHSDLSLRGNAPAYTFNAWYLRDSGKTWENAIARWTEADGLRFVFGLDTWGKAEHVSTTGPDVVLSASDDYGGAPMIGEVWTAAPFRRLVHHRSTSSNYWAQPQAAQSASGRFVFFASDWGGATDAEGFLIEVPQ